MRKKTKLVHGVGINDADYNVIEHEKINGKRKIVWRYHYYTRWENLLKRCYSGKFQEKHHTYKGCSVCDEWLLYSNFRKWMETQNWEGRALDKDFLIEGNKIYSPSTCIFLPRKLNNFIITRENYRGNCPLGVNYMKKKNDMFNEPNKPYRSYISVRSGKRVHLGLYATPEEAHQRYLQEKLKLCDVHIDEFKDSSLILKGLTRIKDKIQYHIDNNLELTSF